MKSLLCALIVLAAAPSALAQCCHHCGCESNCRKVCRPVCEIKEVPKVTYDCECEDFCIPGPSCRTTVCDDCGHRKHVYTPTCGKVHTRTKLIKHETMEKKVTYKWVVETMCCGCEAKCAAAENATVTVDALGMATLIPATLGAGQGDAGNQVAPAAFQEPVAVQDPVTAAQPAAAEPVEKPSGAKFGWQRILAPLFGKSRTSDDQPAPAAAQ